MLNVSAAFRRKLYADERDYINTCEITLSDGTHLTVDNEHILSNGVNIEDAVSEDESFTALGSVVINAATVILYNNDEIYSDYNFENAQVVLYTALEVSTLVNGEETIITEQLKKGTYRVDEAVYDNASITLSLLDYMEQFDRPYSLSSLVYPATLSEIVEDACLICDVSLATNSLNFPHKTYEVPVRPEDSDLTFREVLGYVASIAGCFARCNVDGELEFKWFNTALLEEDTDLDGGTFNPWTAGAITDGGTFNPWTAGSVIGNELFTDERPLHYIVYLYSQNIAVDDTVITGVRILVKIEDTESDSDIVKFEQGTSGYVIEIAENPFITIDTAPAILTWLSTQLIGLTFRKCNVSQTNDPSIEAGDVGYIWDTKGDEHPILITRVTFSPTSPQTIVCGAETPSKNSATRFSSQTKSYIESRKQLREQRNTFQAAMEDLQEEIENAAGLYYTAVTQQDQSVIHYLHDKPLLADSAVRIAISSVGVTVTPDAGAHWYGLTVDGQFLASVINTMSLFFDYAHGGTLILGGANNTNGRLRILDANGNEIGRMDNTGSNLTGLITLENTGSYDKVTTTVGTIVDYVWTTEFSGAAWGNINGFHTYFSRNNKIVSRFGLLDSSTDATSAQETFVTIRNNIKRLWSITKQVNDLNIPSATAGPTIDARLIESLSYDNKYYELASTYGTFAIGQYKENNVWYKGIVIDTIEDYHALWSGISVNAPTRPKIIIIKDGMVIGTSGIYIRNFAEVEFKANPLSATVEGSYLQFQSNSSLRYKHDIDILMDKDIDSHKLYKLPVRQFVYNKDAKLQYPDMKGQIIPGFIAEEVAEIYPVAVIHDPKTGDIESWDERRIIPGMMSLIQEQKEEIDELKERVDKLESMLKKILEVK